MKGLSIRLLDVHDGDQIAALEKLHGDYSVESMNAGGAAGGFAVAWFLHTWLLYMDEEPVGYFSYDPEPPDGVPAIELIYVDPAHRRHGIAEMVIGQMKAKVPGLVLKSPLSPECAALAAKLGVNASVLPPADQAAMASNARIVRNGPNQWCKKQGHRREHAFTACAKCAVEFPRLIAREAIKEQIALIRLTGMPPGHLRTMEALIGAAAANLVHGQTPVETLIGWAKQAPANLRPHIAAAASARHRHFNHLNAA